MNKKALTILAVVILIALAAYATYKQNNDYFAGQLPVATTTETGTQDATTEVVTINGVEMTIPKGAKVEVVTDNGSLPQPIPDLKRTYTFPSAYNAEARKIMGNKIAGLVKSLEENPAQADKWLELGTSRKMVEDYEGARQAWEYVEKLSPTDFVSPANLGFLYGYYLKDLVRAEAEFKKAAKNGPTQVYIYIQTFEFYRDIVGDKTKAYAVLDQGIKNNPDATAQLEELKASYR